MIGVHGSVDSLEGLALRVAGLEKGFAALVAADLALDARLDAVETYGDETTFTVSSVTQSGTVAHTVGYAKFSRVGDEVFGHCRVSFTAAGTAGNAILVNVAGLPGVAVGARLAIGDFLFDDVSVAPYVGAVTANTSATQFQFNAHNSAGLLGVVPNFAIASGDSINFSFRYPVV